jgi:hypothetical protein
MTTFTAMLIGAALGGLTIAAARLIRGEHWVYAIGLLTLPSLYAMFALRIGEPSIAAKEILYGIPYLIGGLAFAFFSARRSAVAVGLLWIIHGLYDIWHHLLIDNPGVPVWYPAFCFWVDVVIGAYLLWISRRLPDANLHSPRV